MPVGLVPLARIECAYHIPILRLPKPQHARSSPLSSGGRDPLTVKIRQAHCTARRDVQNFCTRETSEGLLLDLARAVEYALRHPRQVYRRPGNGRLR